MRIKDLIKDVMKEEPKRYKCPFCLHEFTRSEAKTIERNGIKIYQCPNTAKDPETNKPVCGKDLPLRFFQGESAVVSIAGGTGTGKTYFFMALARILENSAFNSLGIYGDVFFGDDASKGYYDDLLNKINTNKTIDATKMNAGNEKIALGIEVNIKSGRRSKTVYFSFFDNPGEGFGDVNYIVSNMNLHRSDAVLFLIAPEQIEGLIPFIKDPTHGTSTAATPIAKVMNNVRNVLLRDETVSEHIGFFKWVFGPNRNKIHIPFAFCISKYDLVKDAFGIEIPNDFDKSTYIDYEKHGLVDRIKEIRSGKRKWFEVFKKGPDPSKDASKTIQHKLFNQFSAHAVEDIVKGYFSKYEFFGVQSIEQDFTNASTNIRLTPQGVAKTIIWILKKLKLY